MSTIIKSGFSYLFILSLLLPVQTQAEEEIKIIDDDEAMHPALMLLLFEGLVGFNAWWASENPHAYGGIAALLFPLVAGEGASTDTEFWVSTIGAESIALYNIGINESRTSKSEIFKNNMIAWHLFGGVVGLTGYLVGDKDTDTSVRLLPNYHGGAHIVYRHTF